MRGARVLLAVVIAVALVAGSAPGLPTALDSADRVGPLDLEASVQRPEGTTEDVGTVGSDGPMDDPAAGQRTGPRAVAVRPPEPQGEGSWWDALDAVLPPGVERVEPPACQETCPLALRRTDSGSAPADEDSLLPQVNRLPWPAPDLDGDGTDDVYLLPGWPGDDGAQSEDILVLSGADGTVLDRVTFDAQFFYPVYPYAIHTADRTLQLFWVAEEGHTVPCGDFYCSGNFTVWSGWIVARNAASGEIVWRDHESVDVNPNGSGSATWIWYGSFDRYRSEGMQAIRDRTNITWPSDGYFYYTHEDSEDALVEADTLTVHWSVDGEIPAVGRLQGADGALDLVLLEGRHWREPTPEADTEVQRRDGADYGLMWAREEAELGFEPNRVNVGSRAGAPLLVVTGHESDDGTVPAVGIDGQGATVWSHPAAPGALAFARRLGSLDGEDADLVGGFGLTESTCDGEGTDGTRRVSATPAVISLEDGRTLWSREIVVEAPSCYARPSFIAGLGDFDGDGIGDLAAEVPLDDYGSLWYGADAWRMILWSGVAGEALLDTTFGGHDTSVLEEADRQWTWHRILPLHYVRGDPDALIVPFLDATITWTERPWYGDLVSHRMVLAVLDPATGTWSNTTIDHRVFNPAATYGGPYYVAFPPTLFPHQLDRTLTFFEHQDQTCVWSTCEDHSRYGLYVHDPATGEELWSRESDAPLDIQLLEQLP